MGSEWYVINNHELCVTIHFPHINSGAKEYVINAANADFLIVGAQTNTRNFLGDNTETMTAFIVDLKQPGVTVHAPNVSIGCNGINQARVSFKNVKISASKSIHFSFGQRLQYLII